MGIVRSLTNWAKALGYLLTGRLDSAREALDSNPHVVKATFDEIIVRLTGRLVIALFLLLLAAWPLVATWLHEQV